MEPKKTCNNCLHKGAPCIMKELCNHWKPGHAYWKEKFQDKTRNGREWVIYAEFEGRLYGRIFAGSGWAGLSWGMKGNCNITSSSGHDLLPRESDIYDTPEWEAYKEAMGLVATNEDYKANFKKLYNARFRLEKKDEKET